MSDWINLPLEDDMPNWFGFVYIIERTVEDPANPRKYYIGCKQLHSKTKRPPLKSTGLKRKRTIVKKSDYETYYGSSEELKKEVEKYGKENFKRTVLALTTCKWEHKYLELLYQIKYNVIADEAAWNGILNLRIGKCPKALKEKYLTTTIFTI